MDMLGVGNRTQPSTTLDAPPRPASSSALWTDGWLAGNILKHSDQNVINGIC